MRILLLTDPGVPARNGERLRNRLDRRLRSITGAPTEIATRVQLVPLTVDQQLKISGITRISRENFDADACIVLTEMPRLRKRRPIVAEVFPADRVAVVSYSALGPWATRRRCVDTITECVRILRGEGLAPGARPNRRIRREQIDEDRSVYTIFAPRFRGPAALVAGMIRSNEPWRTVPRLSSALAAAAATGAFGIFYNSIWQMSAILSPTRLTIIVLGAVLILAGWLMVQNR